LFTQTVNQQKTAKAKNMVESAFPQTEVYEWRNKLGGWLTVFSQNDISGLRRPKNIKFGTKVASIT